MSKSVNQKSTEKYEAKLKKAKLKRAMVAVHEDELKLFRDLLDKHVFPLLPITKAVKKAMK